MEFTQKELKQLAEVLFGVCIKLKEERRQKYIRDLAADSLASPMRYYNATTSHHQGPGGFGEWEYSLYEASEVYNYFCTKVSKKIKVPKGTLSKFSNQMLIREVHRSKVENLKKFIRRDTPISASIKTDLKLCLKYLEISAHFAQSSNSKASLKMKSKSSLGPGFIDLVFLELKRKNLFEEHDFNWNKFLFFITFDFSSLKNGWADFSEYVMSRFADNLDLLNLLPTRAFILKELQLHANAVFSLDSVNLKSTEVELLKDRLSKQRKRATDK